MGVINKIREKTGLVIGLVAFSLILFLLGADFFSPNTGIFGAKNSEVIAEIDGEEVNRARYQQLIDQMTYNYTSQTGNNPDANVLNSIRQQAWTTLVNDIAFKNQYEELGVSVSDMELTDMVQGSNISEDVKRAFTDPNTGQFDKNGVIRTLQNIAQQPIEQQARWQEFEQNILKNRERTKFFNLLTKTNYATKAEAEAEYEKTTQKANVKYLFVPYRSIADSTVSVSDSELKAYLNEHSAEYEREESRDLKYVSFPVNASKEDIASLRKEINALVTPFRNASSDSIFAAVNSEKDNFFQSHSGDNLPPSLKTEDLEIGKVYGPYRIGSEHHLYKVTDINNEGKATARASHILFKWDNEDEKAATKKEARGILRKIKNGADFAEMARLHGTDGTASKGGDLGYFGEGSMVPEFQDAVFGAKKEGLLSDVVETQFGYHIIDVTSIKSNKQFIIASIVQEIYPSDETRNGVYRKAELFASKYTTLDALIQGAKEENLKVKESKNLGSNARAISGIENSRAIVAWLYRDAKLNEVSEVFDIDDQYIIAAMSGKQEEGVANLSAVRNEVERKVRNEKKAEMIKSKLAGMDGSLDDIRDAYGSDATAYTMTDLAFSSNSLNTVGFAPKAVGRAFALKAGEKTAPFATDSGVLIMELISKTEVPAASDHAVYRKQVEDRRSNSISYAVSQVVEEKADISDTRYKFF